MVSEEKRKKKFKLRNPFKRPASRKRPNRAPEVSPAKTDPNLMWDDDAYEPPSPTKLFASNYAENPPREEAVAEKEEVPLGEIQFVKEQEKARTNDGWAKFDARPVEQLPKPEARSRRQLVQGQASQRNKEKPSTGPVDLDKVEGLESAIEVSTPKRGEGRVEEKRDQAEDVASLEKSSPESVNGGSSLSSSSMVDTTKKNQDKPKVYSSPKAYSSAVQSISSRPSDEDTTDAPYPMLHKSREQVKKPVEAPKPVHQRSTEQVKPAEKPKPVRQRSTEQVKPVVEARLVPQQSKEQIKPIQESDFVQQKEQVKKVEETRPVQEGSKEKPKAMEEPKMVRHKSKEGPKPQPVRQQSKEKLRRLDPPKNDKRHSSSRRPSNNAGADPPAPHGSDNVWSQFGLSVSDSGGNKETDAAPVQKSVNKTPNRKLDDEAKKKEEKVNAGILKTKKTEEFTNKVEGKHQTQDLREKTEKPTRDIPMNTSLDSTKVAISERQGVVMIMSKEREMESTPQRLEPKLQGSPQRAKGSNSPTRATAQRSPIMPSSPSRAKGQDSPKLATSPDGADEQDSSKAVSSPKKVNRSTEEESGSLALATTTSMSTERAGTKKVNRDWTDKNVIEQALGGIEELQQEEDVVSFDESFERILNESEPEMIEEPLPDKSKLVRYVPTMSETGETELVAVYEDVEDPEKQAKANTESNQDPEYTLLPNPFLKGLWQEANPPSVNDDHTVSTLTRDYPSVYSVNTRDLNVTSKDEEHEYSHDARDSPRKSIDTTDHTADSLTADSREYTDQDTFDSRDYTADSRDYTAQSKSFETYTADSRDYTEQSKSFETFDDDTYTSRETGTYTGYTDTVATRETGYTETIATRETGYTGYTDTVATRETGYTGYTGYTDTVATRETGYTDTVATLETGYTEFTDAVATRETDDYTDFTGTVVTRDTGRTGRSTRFSKRSRMKGTRTAESLTSTSFKPRTLKSVSASFTEDEYTDEHTDDDETIETEYTNNDKQPSALDELKDMAEELRQSGPGVIMNWLS